MDDLKIFNEELEIKLQQYRAQISDLQSDLVALSEQQIGHEERVQQLRKEKDQLRCEMEIDDLSSKKGSVIKDNLMASILR